MILCFRPQEQSVYNITEPFINYDYLCKAFPFCRVNLEMIAYKNKKKLSYKILILYNITIFNLLFLLYLSCKWHGLFSLWVCIRTKFNHSNLLQIPIILFMVLYWILCFFWIFCDLVVMFRLIDSQILFDFYIIFVLSYKYKYKYEYILIVNRYLSLLLFLTGNIKSFQQEEFNIWLSTFWF